MIDCPIRNIESLKNLLAGKLSPVDRKRFRDHLEQPCDRCLELFSILEPGEIMEWASSPATELSSDEADRIYQKALDSVPAVSLKRSIWSERRFLLIPATAVLVFATITGLFFYIKNIETPEPGSYVGIKGNEERNDIKAELIAVVGNSREGRPKVDRRLTQNEFIGPDEVLLFRYRLNRDAFVYLIAQGRASPVLLHSFELEKQPKGERELVSKGRALAFDPKQLGEEVRIVLLAAVERVSGLDQLKDLEVLLNRNSLEKFCKKCAVDILTVSIKKPSVLK